MDPTLLSSIQIKKINSVSTLFTFKNTKLKRRDRLSWAIVIKYEGETVYRSRGKTYLSDRSHVIILPKGCSYQWICTKSGHFSIIEFECDATDEGIFQFTVKNGDKLLKAFKELEKKRYLGEPMIEMQSIRDTYSILLELLLTAEEKPVPDGKQKKLLPAVEYLSQNYDKNIKNDTLAALVGISTVYFRKLFKEVTGTSPISYARELRIRKAKELLKSEYGSLTEIALSLGYANLYDFSRDFKKHTGFPPSKY